MMMDQCIVDVINRCLQLRSIDLGGCNRLTDAGVSALGRECGQLQTITLSGCYQVTDAGISALGHGCGQLQTIDISFSNSVTQMQVHQGRGMAVVSCRALFSHIVIR